PRLSIFLPSMIGGSAQRLEHGDSRECRTEPKRALPLLRCRSRVVDSSVIATVEPAPVQRCVLYTFADVPLNAGRLVGSNYSLTRLPLRAEKGSLRGASGGASKGKVVASTGGHSALMGSANGLHLE